MRFKLILSVLLPLFTSSLLHTQTYTVSGYVIDQKTAETIIGVNITVRGTSSGAATDGNGYFRIASLPPGKYVLDVSHIAYDTDSVAIILEDNSLILDEIALVPKAIKFEEVVVTGKSSEIVDAEVEAGHHAMTPQAIRSIPAIRSDVFRAVKYLPGITGVDPISPLYSVRGGEPGENLILLDGVTIYNPYHFVTAAGLFNLNAVKNVEMMVGGFGAEYGGRNSSVLYVTTREGNNKQLHGEIEPGITHSQFALDYPVGENATMMVSGRAYYDLVSRFLLYAPSYFYDMNVSFNWVLGRKNRLNLRFFQSRDYVDFKASNYVSYLSATFNTDVFDGYEFVMKNKWDNRAVTVILKTIVSPSVYLKTQISGSFFSSGNLTVMDYEYFDEDENETTKLFYSTDIKNKIRDLSAKSTLSMQLTSGNALKVGGEFSQYYFSNDISINDISEGVSSREPFLFAGFIEDRLDWHRLTFRAGMRVSKFSFTNQWYNEPRFNAVLALPYNIRLKTAWGKYYQYITSINSQEYEFSQYLDYYYALKVKKPGASTHYILGLDKPITDNSQLSLDLYYKDISQVYTFDYNISELEAFQFSDKLKAGSGKSYGAELLWQGNWKTLSGWLSYGISKSTRSYPHLMNGRTFLFDYDRLHSFKAVINHQIHPRLSYSGTLRIMSGVPKTIETSRKSYFYYDPLTATYSSYPTYVTETKNNARLPLYIRLDLGLKKQIRRGFAAEVAEFLGAKESYLNISFSNLLFLFHRNVWFYFPVEEGKLYGFGTNYFPVFSTSYTIKF
jgi:hypothetical protein